MNVFGKSGLALLLAGLLVSGAAVAKVSIQFPLLYEYSVKKKGKSAGTQVALISKVDSKIPSYIEFSTADEASEGLKKYEGPAEEALGTLPKGLGAEMLRYGSLDLYVDKNVGSPVCYKGDPREAVGLIGSLADIALSDQMQIVGWKYKAEVHAEAEEGENLDEFMPEIWKNWRGNGTAILIVTVDNDDGDNFSGAIVRHCDSPVKKKSIKKKH
jgi:hypothetical protein